MNGTCPYKDLYVYVIDGIVDKAHEICLGEGFIGNWIEGKSSFLFFSYPADVHLNYLFHMRPNLQLMDKYYFTYNQWQGGNLESVRVGAFVIIPPWIKAPVSDEEIKILLDPGVVFGNCLHPTTRHCLEAIFLANRDRNIKRVTDLGTGTGVLAIACACLGAEEVLAVDFNPLCVKTAEKNVDINGFAGVIWPIEGGAEDFACESSDLIVANIHYDVICKLFEMECFLKQKMLILSGLLRSQWGEIEAKLSTNHYKIIRKWDHEMTWFTVLSTKETY
jgi:ribosomal protein L11 methyltransferase